MLRCLFAVVLVCSLTRLAKADDFKDVIVDPTVPLDLIQEVTSDDFTVSFPTTGPAAGCQASQLPGVSDPQDFDACFTGINLTGKPLTAIDIELPVFTDPYTGLPDTPSCPTETSDVFTSITCGYTNGGADYLLEFSGGNIPNATIFNSFCYFDPFGRDPGVDCDSPAIFTIAIGIPTPPGDAPLTSNQITEFFDTGTSAVADDSNPPPVEPIPEPSSILLMSTGVLSIGLFSAYRRRNILVTPRSNRASLD
jgi:hypothetical protein